MPDRTLSVEGLRLVQTRRGTHHSKVLAKGNRHLCSVANTGSRLLGSAAGSTRGSLKTASYRRQASRSDTASTPNAFALHAIQIKPNSAKEEPRSGTVVKRFFRACVMNVNFEL